MAQYLNVIKNLDFCIQSVRTSNALHNLERNSDHPLSHGTFTKKNPVFRCPLLGSLLYSGDLNTDHLNTGNIWLPNFLKFKFQMVQYSMGYVPCTVMTILILDQYIKKHDGFHLSGIKMVGLSSIQMAFENQTIWHPTYFRPFEYQTSSVFKSHCIMFDGSGTSSPCWWNSWAASRAAFASSNFWWTLNWTTAQPLLFCPKDTAVFES